MRIWGMWFQSKDPHVLVLAHLRVFNSTVVRASSWVTGGWTWVQIPSTWIFFQLMLYSSFILSVVTAWNQVQIPSGFPKFSVNAVFIIWLTIFILFSELYEFGDEGVQSIYWNVNYPWPMSNRDVSFEVHVVISIGITLYRVWTSGV